MLQQLYLDAEPAFAEQFEPDLLKGVVTLSTEGKRLSETDWTENGLYRTYAGRQYEKQTIKLVPYYAWCNRTPGEMAVWIRI